MNSLRVTDTHPNAQLNTSTHLTADLLRPRTGAVLDIDQLSPGLNYFDMYGHSVFGQTLGLDVQGRALDDGVTPQPGIVDFARQLCIQQDQLVMPRLDQHTTDVLVVDNRDQLLYDTAEGRVVGYNPAKDTTYIDALIIKESPETAGMVLGIAGADCPAIVGSARLQDGKRVIFGIHAGRKGCLGGIVENTAVALLEQGVIAGSVRIAIGPGGQTLELPLSVVQKEASANKHVASVGIWKQSAVSRFNAIDTRNPMIIYDNQADVIRRAQLAFGGLVAPSGCTIIDANTLTDRGLKSYRATTIAKAAGDHATVQEKTGRNALFTRFYW